MMKELGIFLIIVAALLGLNVNFPGCQEDLIILGVYFPGIEFVPFTLFVVGVAMLVSGRKK